jgi:hypothetical protein
MNSATELCLCPEYAYLLSLCLFNFNFLKKRKKCHFLNEAFRGEKLAHKSFVCGKNVGPEQGFGLPFHKVLIGSRTITLQN